MPTLNIRAPLVTNKHTYGYLPIQVMIQTKSGYNAKRTLISLTYIQLIFTYLPDKDIVLDCKEDVGVEYKTVNTTTGCEDEKC